MLGDRAHGRGRRYDWAVSPGNSTGDRTQSPLNPLWNDTPGCNDQIAPGFTRNGAEGRQVRHPPGCAGRDHQHGNGDRIGAGSANSASGYEEH